MSMTSIGLADKQNPVDSRHFTVDIGHRHRRIPKKITILSNNLSGGLLHPIRYFGLFHQVSRPIPKNRGSVLNRAPCCVGHTLHCEQWRDNSRQR